ncbi:hypothetical protein [Dyadobacter bucti]|uniref:hypothetical protein n=1 Tax=Dyadobacter bucti TaxID=2572203 RepID=UPI00110944BB|nr:hypothetical protein [Dyadobacter bucti]
MRTTSDVESILFEHIKGSDLDLACNGGVWMGERAAGSELEDIVINSLTITVGGIQRAVANVNIYVKDVSVPGSSNHNIKDSGRIKVLSDLAIELLKEFSTDDHDFWVAGQGVFQEPDIGQHYINFRIDHTIYNA